VFLHSGLKLSFYVSELKYPPVELRLPTMFEDENEIVDVLREKNLAWISFCLNGLQGDIA